MNVYQKLTAVQNELKAPKNQRNTFGGYNYRSCEDILEAVKPILSKHGCSVWISDEIVLIGERYYVKATATFIDHEPEREGMLDCGCIKVSALAREELDKKGMDASQITGAASSYARKYALNGLFAIDDTKDADADEVPTEKPTPKKVEHKKEEKPKADYNDTTPNKPEPKVELTPSGKPKPTETQLALLFKLCHQKGVGKTRFTALCGLPYDSPELTADMVSAMMTIVADLPDAPTDK